MPEAMLSKIRKLLAKAEDPACTAAESAAFTAKATELIARYGVDQALLAARDPGVDPVGDRVVDVPAPYARDKAGLLAAVADPLRCRCVRRRDGAGYQLHLFGFASDLARVDLLFTSLLVQAAHGLAGAIVPAGEQPAAFRRSWLAGFAQVIGERLRQAEAGAATRIDGPSYALVLADRSDRVQRRVAEVYPRLRTAPPRRLVGRGFGSGVEAGHRADLGGTAIPTPSPPNPALPA
ncbi:MULTISPECIES: DUF2786 domain-containing protein [Micromonospora]|uniref:Uncharacterized protein n=1 Tax=Micromonospora yangpuensis TaxID=683228 RepID=A0A1C6TYP9_9ACTN|nr:DUF2786 domain-containing protein [Micromonospora yangpuensis]GGM20252.1 hypothetical protein GCM10012279_43250 [Micromonospora yangpuensis]SCL46741.1 Protein of unknown function [Micromonospora yangpuensis]